MSRTISESTKVTNKTMRTEETVGRQEVLSNEVAMGLSCQWEEVWEQSAVGKKHSQCKDPEAGMSQAVGGLF